LTSTPSLRKRKRKKKKASPSLTGLLVRVVEEEDADAAVEGDAGEDNPVLLVPRKSGNCFQSPLCRDGSWIPWAMSTF
jgi:hypothetical protein